MDIYLHLLAGVFGGLLAANWNAFKDSPWEGFKYIKYIDKKFAPFCLFNLDGLKFF